MSKLPVFGLLAVLSWVLPAYAVDGEDFEDAQTPEDAALGTPPGATAGRVPEILMQPATTTPATVPSSATTAGGGLSGAATSTFAATSNGNWENALGLMEEFALPKSTKGQRYELTLKQAITRALDYNRPFQTAKSALTKADLTLRDAQAQFRPRLTLSGSETLASGATNTSITQSTSKDTLSATLSEKLWTGTDLGVTVNTSNDHNPAVSDRANASAMSVTLSQPLVGPNSPHFAKESLIQARRSRVYSQHQFEQSKRDKILEVTREYYNTVTQLQYYDINKKSLERLLRLLLATQERTKVGLATQLDVSRVEGEVSAQRQTLNTAKKYTEDQLDTMRLLLGLSLDDDVVLLDEIIDQPMDFDFSQVFEIAWANRTDYLDQQRQVEDEERRLRITRQKWWPDLSLKGDYNSSQSANSFRGSLGSATQSWSVGLNASYSFPVSNTSRGIAAAEIDFQNAKRALEQRRDEIVRELKFSVRQVQESKARVGTTTEKVTQSEKRRAIATFRFEKGAADNLEVVLAEEQLLRARNEYATAVKDHLMAQSELKNRLGILKVDE